MPRIVIEAIDDLFENVADRDELKYHMKLVCRALHEAGCKQSIRVFGVYKHCTGQVIKQALRDRKIPVVEYSPNLNPKK